MEEEKFEKVIAIKVVKDFEDNQILGVFSEVFYLKQSGILSIEKFNASIGVQDDSSVYRLKHFAKFQKTHDRFSEMLEDFARFFLRNRECATILVNSRGVLSAERELLMEVVKRKLIKREVLGVNFFVDISSLFVFFKGHDGVSLYRELPELEEKGVRSIVKMGMTNYYWECYVMTFWYHKMTAVLGNSRKPYFLISSPNNKGE